MLLLNCDRKRRYIINSSLTAQKIINFHCPRFLFSGRKVFITEENVETNRCSGIKVSLPLFSVLWCNWSSSCICRVAYLPTGRNDESFAIHGSISRKNCPLLVRSSFEYPLEVSWNHPSQSKHAEDEREMDRWKSYIYIYIYLNIVTVSQFTRLSCCVESWKSFI